MGQKRVFKAEKNAETHTYKEAYLWEAYPLNGNIVFGVSPTREEAIRTIEKFKENNKGRAIEPFHYIIDKAVADNADYFKTFNSYCPKGYRILYLIDINALRIIKYDGLRNAAIYYDKKSPKNYGESMEYLSDLHNNFKPYRFDDTTFNQVSQNLSN